METKGFLFLKKNGPDREECLKTIAKRKIMQLSLKSINLFFFFLVNLERKHTALHRLDNLWWPDLAQHFLVLCVSPDEPVPQAGSDSSCLSELASESVAWGADVSVAPTLCNAETQVCLEREEGAEWLGTLLAPQTSRHHSVTKTIQKWTHLHSQKLNMLAFPDYFKKSIYCSLSLCEGLNFSAF